MAKAFKPVGPVFTPPHSPAHKIASQFQNVHPKGNTEGYAAERDMYEVDRAQNFLTENPYGITHGKP